MDYTKYFEFKNRSDGSKFVCLKDGAPALLSAFIKLIHIELFFGCLPNDWIYKTIYEAFDELSEDALEDITIEADDYPNEYLTWLHENYKCFAQAYCDEWVCDFGDNQANDIDKIITGGQWLARDRIYNRVAFWLDAREASHD